MEINQGVFELDPSEYVSSLNSLTSDVVLAEGTNISLVTVGNTITINATDTDTGITQLTGDVTAGPGSGSQAATLATVNSNVGTFGSATEISQITANAKGLVTAASNVSIQIAESQVTNLVSDLAGKQPTGNYITALTGDGTASGPGSVALTLATVNADVGSYGSSTSIPSLTVNAKGLITAASGNAVIAPAGTLTGTTLASNVVTSSLTTVGTLTNLTVTNAPTFSAIPTGRIPYTTTAGLVTSSTGLTYNGTTFASGILTGLTASSVTFALSPVDTSGSLFLSTYLPSTTANSTVNNWLYDANVTKKVASGVTDLGRVAGMRFSVLRNFLTTADSGTLASLQGMIFQHGHFNSDVTATPITTDTFGLQVSLGSLTGTITTASDIRIGGNSSAGTVTTHIGLEIGALLGTTVRGISSAVASASGRHNLYISGTADNYLEGSVGIGDSSPTEGKLTVSQASTTAAIPPLYLNQADVSEEMIEFNSTIGTGNAIEAVGSKTLTVTHFIKVTLPGGLTRYLPVGTIA